MRNTEEKRARERKANQQEQKEGERRMGRREERTEKRRGTLSIMAENAQTTKHYNNNTV